MRQRAYVEILSTREVWRARKRRKSAPRATLASLIKAINAAVNLKFCYCSALKAIHVNVYMTIFIYLTVMSLS